MSDTRTYNDLDEVLNAMDSWWGKRADEIERTKENETILSDGLFWCGVNMIRFTYPHSHINRLMSFFLSVKECWRKGRHMRYIDADKLIDDIRPFAEYDSNRSNKDWVRRFEIAIDDQPTADVRENVKGRWVEVVDRTEMYDKEGVKTWGMLFQCNQCGFVLNAIEGHTGQYNYCPNCGADMRGEQDE